MSAGHRQAGSNRSIEALAARYGGALRSYFERRSGDRTEAEDLTQDLLASLARRAELENIQNIEGYIFRAAKNLLARRRRAAASRPLLQFEGAADPLGKLRDELSPEDIVLAQERMRLFVSALDALPERARTIFVLNRFEEMTGREIADRLGLSLSLVEKEMIRSIRTLREALQ